MPGGGDGQLGLVSEVTPGTLVTVTKFPPFLSENIKNNIAYMDSQTISARRTLRITKKGAQQVEGGISLELGNATIATLMKHMFGAVATTGAGPYTHTYTPGDLTGKSMTVQVGRPATTGTVHPFTYGGVKVREWTISCNVGEIAKLDVSVIGMSETTATALATASYDATWSPFVFTEGTVTVAGSAVGTVRSLSLTGTNMVDHRHRVGSSSALQPLEVGVRPYTGTITSDFDALTNYALFTAGTQAAVVLAFTNGTHSLTITMNAQFVGETPEVSGYELLAQPLPFRAMSGTSDAAAITAVLVNGESSAA